MQENKYRREENKKGRRGKKKTAGGSTSDTPEPVGKKGIVNQ